MSDRELEEHGRRIAELERQVAELYRRLGQARPAGFDTDYGFPSEPRAAEDPRVLELVGRGRKIEAIKVYRELTGVGLREAKEAIEAIEAGVAPPE